MFHDNLPPLTGEEFRRLREYFGLSQENAARLLNMSSKSQISRMERKKQELVPANIVQNFVQGLTETGGAARTCFHDYNTGETYSCTFNGAIGDVILYNSAFDLARGQEVYDFLSDRYRLGTVTHPAALLFPLI